MTGLANRRTFRQLVDHHLALYQRLGTTFGLVYLDIDHFKQINDQHGHQLGDAVLQQLAHIMQQECRDIDGIARLGGEEFAMLIAGCDRQQAANVAERLRARLSAAEVAGLPVTASFGVTLVRLNDNWDTLLQRADSRLYAAKNQGRNCVVMSTPAQ